MLELEMFLNMSDCGVIFVGLLSEALQVDKNGKDLRTEPEEHLPSGIHRGQVPEEDSEPGLCNI